MSIEILPQKVANQIAAGEVVERPASVVKELVENSLDAGAKFIEIEIRSGGKDFIQIKDDGMGMSPEDARKSVLRHATSKIKKVDDLFSVQTFGFRGEALAAICAVSKFRLTTRTQADEMGICMTIEGDRIKTSEVGANIGTTIVVEDLFFTTPARKQYLKSESVEYRAIIREVKAFALAHFRVGFRVIHEDKKALDYTAVENSESRVVQIMKKRASDFVRIESEEPHLKIQGFVGRPEVTLTNRNQQFLFVNGRHVEDYKLHYALREGYNLSCGIEKHRFPISVVFVEIEPILVDVNVHPRKIEVKFSEPFEVFEAMKKSVYKGLSKASNLPQNLLSGSSDFERPSVKREEDSGSVGGQSRYKNEAFLKNFSSSPQSISGQQVLEVQNFNEILSGKSESALGGAEAEPFVLRSDDEGKYENQRFSNGASASSDLESLGEETLGDLQCIGQVDKKYILAQGELGLFIFDQHALHERQRFEFFWKKYHDQPPKPTPLLVSQRVNLEEELILVLSENKSKLSHLGFVFTFPEDDVLEITAVPDIVKSENLSDLMGELADYFAQDQIGEHKVDQLLRRMIEYKACRGAVMFGDRLHREEMVKILGDLKNTQFKWLCAHGRPNYIFLGFDFLDRQFHR